MDALHCPTPGPHLQHSGTQTEFPACCGAMMYSLVQELVWSKSQLQQARIERPDATVSSQLAASPTAVCVVPSTVTQGLPLWGPEFRAEPQSQTEPQNLKQELVGPDVIKPSTSSLDVGSGASSISTQAEDLTMDGATSSPILSTAPDHNFTADPTEAVPPAGFDLKLEPPSLDPAIDGPLLLTTRHPLQDMEYAEPFKGEMDILEWEAAPEEDTHEEPEAATAIHLAASPATGGVDPDMAIEVLIPSGATANSLPKTGFHHLKQPLGSVSRSGCEESTSNKEVTQHRRCTHYKLRGSRESTTAGNSNSRTDRKRNAGAFGVPSARTQTQRHRCPARAHPSASPGQKKLQSSSSSHLCSQCGKTYSYKSLLQQHQLTHTRERPHGCTECGRRFSQLNDLRRHRRTVHEGERPHCCHHCGKAFGLLCNLEDHIRTHTGERPFSCQFCERSFSQKSNLKTHIRTHTAERPYACGQCEKRFGYRSALITHRLTHTNERPFACDHCKKTFKCKFVLKRHLVQHIGQ